MSELAERFQRIVPEGFIVLASEPGRVLRPGELLIYGPRVLQHFSAVYGEELQDDGVDSVAASMASDIQDAVAEATTLPWPGVTQMPNPDTAVREGVLYVWFGDELDPVLKLELIQLR